MGTFSSQWGQQRYCHGDGDDTSFFVPHHRRTWAGKPPTMNQMKQRRKGVRRMSGMWTRGWRVPCVAGVVAVACVAALSSGCAAATESAKAGGNGGGDALRSIGVVNPQSVLERSNVGRVAIDQLKQFVEERRKQLATEEIDIKALDQKLKDQDKTFTDAQRQERRNQLAGRVQQYQQKTQQLNQEIAAKQTALTNESLQKIRAAIKTVAKDAGVSIVLHEGTESNLLVVLYHDTRVDLTERVLQEVNRQNP